MLNVERTRQGVFYIPMAVLVLVVMSMWLFQIADTYHICMGLLFIGCAVIRPLPFRSWSMIDIVLGVMTLYDVSSCFYGDCPIPAIEVAFNSICCFTVYGIARRLFTEPRTSKILLFGSYLPISIVLLLTLGSFFIFRNSVLEAGFEDTYHFRFLFRPLGYITNWWAEILLVLLGWVCLARKYNSILVLLTAWAVLLSFSRGAYIALGVYVVGWLLFVKPWQEKLRVSLLCLAAVVVTAYCLPDEFKTTLRMNATTSQQQSTEARVSATRAAWNSPKGTKEILFGRGNRSYNYTVDGELNQDSTRTYTNIAPNLPILLWIEKGVTGILLYFLLAVGVIRCMWKYRKEPDTWIVGCTLLAVMVKEMTQANLFSIRFVWFMFYLILAFLQRKQPLGEIARKERYILPGILVVCYVGWLLFFCFQNRNETACVESFAALKRGDTEESVRLIEQTSEFTPWLIQRARIYGYAYRQTGTFDYALRAEQALEQAERQQPGDIHIRYMKADLYLSTGETKRARPILMELVEEYPRNSLYLLAYWKCLYQESRKEKALPYLVGAIQYTPRILTMVYWKDLQRTDSAYYESARETLIHLGPREESGATDWARMGYIAHWCGNRMEAQIYLKEAVKRLPNLITPWRLLGEDRKYRLLQLGAFRKDIFSLSIPEEPDMTEELLFLMSYKGKFWEWYGTELKSWELE